MAIFIGNWNDGDGVPFDPNAIARRGTGDSHQCQVKAHHIANEILHHSWHSVMPQLRDRWTNVLTDEQRSNWAGWAPNQYPARDYAQYIGDKPFVAFASANWPVAWQLSDRWRDDPNDLALFIDTITFDSAVAATQLITITCTYNSPPGPLNPGATYFFQVNPARFNSKRHHRFTQALGALYEFDLITPTYIFQATASYPFAAGQTVRVIYRHCYGASWNATIHLDKVAA